MRTAKWIPSGTASFETECGRYVASRWSAGAPYVVKRRHDAKRGDNVSASVAVTTDIKDPKAIGSVDLDEIDASCDRKLAELVGTVFPRNGWIIIDEGPWRTVAVSHKDVTHPVGIPAMIPYPIRKRLATAIVSVLNDDEKPVTPPGQEAALATKIEKARELARQFIRELA